jgi:hypothetical protein
MRINATACALLLTVFAASSCLRATRQAVSQAVGCEQFPEHEPLFCERRSDGVITVAQRSLPQMNFDESGFGAMIVGGRGLYFVNRQGKTAPAFPFDNGPDYFVEGLARTVKNGKVGFVNAKLDRVIAPAWDFATPFDHGVAAVCTGCTPKSDGEHTIMTGGKWGYIDAHGSVVVPVTYDSRDLPSPEAAALLKSK